MKIPNEIRIAGVDYKVEYVNSLNDGSKLCYGMIDFDKCKIFLNTNETYDHQKMSIVLLHEILHGIIENAEFQIEIEEEEKLVRMLSRGLYQVLQDNGRKLFDIVDKQDEK